MCLPAGITGLAINSAKAVCAGRGPMRHMKRHLGSAGSGVDSGVARCCGACAVICACSTGSVAASLGWHVCLGFRDRIS